MISSVASYRQTANPNVVITNNNRKVNINQIDKSTGQINQSTLATSTRDNFVSMINRYSNDDNQSEILLNNFEKGSVGGLLTAGLPDLSNPDAMRRSNRVTSLFNAEQKSFEQQKTDLIQDGRSAGKSAQTILDEMISLYDSQSDLFKTGIGWDGDVFAFDSASPEGFARTMRYTSDTIDIRA